MASDVFAIDEDFGLHTAPPAGRCMGGRGGSSMGNLGVPALRNRMEQEPNALEPWYHLVWVVFQPAGCKDSLESTVGFSLDKSLPLNTFALGLMEMMPVLPK